MPSQKHPIAFPTLLLSLLVVSACASRGSGLQTYPPVELLGSIPKPVPTIDTVTSAQAAAEYNISVETWGQAGWDRVKAVCVWARERGMEIECGTK